MQNPYTAPSVVNDTPQRPNSESGLWRDKGLLVVRLESPRFPNRCLKTDQPCDVRTTIRLNYVPKKTLWVLAGGVIGHAIAKMFFGRTFLLELPISQNLLDEHDSLRRKGTKLVVYSVLGFSFGVVGFVLAMAAGVNETLAMCILLPFLLLPPIAIAAAVYYTIRQKPVVGVVKLDTSFAWISGVNISYLTGLPSWAG